MTTEARAGAVVSNKDFQEVPESSRCDLIMKGGITSGVVYPPAILELARKYRFRSIGGTSAGAIAAAAAAAAEYGRDTEKGGFLKLAEMRDALARPGFLLSLFQPGDDTRALFKGLLFGKDWWARRSKEGPWWRRVLRLPRELRANGLQEALEQCPGEQCRTGQERGVFVAVAVSLVVLLPWALVALCLVPSVGLKWALAALLGGVALFLLWMGRWLGGLVQPLLHGFRTAASPDSQFSICTGFANEGISLTQWMHEYIQAMAGLAPTEPLTLKHLRTRGIDFKAVTSDLTQGRPYTLPLDEHDGSFIFKAEELRRLFPKEVVDWMCALPTQHTRIDLPEGYFMFPTGDELPVLVAMRMSLSFPLLLSTVRLYSVDASVFSAARVAQRTGAKRPVPALEQLKEHWFSDGGIASNFPIHLFDSWMPTHPTFGINLRDSPVAVKHQPSSATPREARRPDDDILLVRPRDFSKARLPLTPITSLPEFLGALFHLAQNFKDDAQTLLPGYRERIAHVSLSDGQGGLNLDMDKDAIRAIADKGERCARLFTDVNGFNFREHQWVRMRALMSLLEHELGRISNIRGATPEGFEQLRKDFRDLLADEKQARDEGNPWYCPVGKNNQDAWAQRAGRRFDALVALMETWSNDEKEWRSTWTHPREAGELPTFYFFQSRGPHPAGMLRVTPEL